ncbi:MAG TPA: hypothetical protein VK530_04680 [Candidatus Acidoferrum sp.]|nr:hypothetical protein [Candidatus Acidoferrum sp.]
MATGCASKCVQQYPRAFDFKTDTFAYRNDLKWEYVFDDTTEKTSTRPRVPEPDYTHHCFPVARSARQFFQHARFAPALPVVDDETYRQLISEVVARDPSECTSEEKCIVIPGFAGLREFSAAKPKLLQEESGGAWQSYFQRGHWRMMVGFTGRHQEREVVRLMKSIGANRPPVVHIVKFPQLTINHALLLYAVEETGAEVRFTTYDPYEPHVPQMLTFNRATREFRFPRNPYFIGGKVDIYEIYRAWHR